MNRRRRILALLGALLGAVATAGGVWWLPARPVEHAPADKAPAADTGPELPPEVLP